MLMTARSDDAQKATIDARIWRAIDGDRVAAEQLLFDLLPRVRNLVRYVLRGDSDVDDVAQLVLIEVMRSLPSYAGQGSFKAWADRITVRAAIRHARRRGSERRRQREMGPELHLVTPEGEAPDAYALRRELALWLDELPDEQRHAVVLHHVVGLSVPELSEELRLPFETVRSRLRLGMEKLRQKLKRRGET
jgi:RNA polymerase sigma-70 factor (ECF subfamily)